MEDVLAPIEEEKGGPQYLIELKPCTPVKIPSPSSVTPEGVQICEHKFLVKQMVKYKEGKIDAMCEYDPEDMYSDDANRM